MIKITHMTKYYVKSKPVITDLNLTFGATGFNAVLGKSGCGKTTLLNILGGIDLDYIGSIEIDGKEMQNYSHREVLNHRNYETSFIYQKGSLFEHMSVKQNIQIVLDLQNKEVDISEILEKVGLKNFENKKVKQLSGGEKQRVAIARAIAKDAKIILADEPTSALDSKNAHRILSLLKEISKDRLVIIVSHDVKKVMQYVDRAIKFVDGQIEEDIVVNEVQGEAYEFKRKKAKVTSLWPIFLNQLRAGFFINLFVVLLMTLVLIATTIAFEQKPVLDEYQQYEETGEWENDIYRNLLTHEANNVDLYNVIKNTNGEDKYEYFNSVSTNEALLTVPSIDQTIFDEEERLLKYENDLFAFNNNLANASDVERIISKYNYYRANSGYGNIIIENISTRLRMIIESNIYGRLAWDEVQLSDYTYTIYNENCDYDLSCGRLPENEEEILITDTIANAYLRKNDIFVSEDDSGKVFDLSSMLDIDLTIGDVYATVDTYNYYKKLTYKVVGVINTNQLNFYEYSTDGNSYNLLSGFERQEGNNTDGYMHVSYQKPYGYVVLHEDLKGSAAESYYYNPIDIEMFSVESLNISGASLRVFNGFDSYQSDNLKIEDDLVIDASSRVHVVSSKIQGHTNLVGNQILVTPSFLQQLYPARQHFESWWRPSAPTVDDWVDSFSTGLHLNGRDLDGDPIEGRIITITLTTPTGDITTDFEIVGIASPRGTTLFYISEEVYDTVNEANQELPIPSYTINLKGYSASERLAIIDEIYNEGYILSPVNTMPGAYMEFVPTQGEVTIVDDWGDEEVKNISPYHLFSAFYDSPATQNGNYFLDVVSNFYVFSLAMGIMISVGLIYLKERKQKENISRLSLLGVKEFNMFFIQAIVYVFMAVVVWLATVYLSDMLINYINGLFTYTIAGSSVVGEVHRIRIISTDLTYMVGRIAGIIMLVVGIISVIVSVQKNKK